LFLSATCNAFLSRDKLLNIFLAFCFIGTADDIWREPGGQPVRRRKQAIHVYENYAYFIQTEFAMGIKFIDFICKKYENLLLRILF
jgi:hypothetical protein